MNQRSTPIDVARLRAGRLAPEGPYTVLDVVPTTGSTNADLRAAAADGADDRTVLISEEQTAGLGRRARHWASPKGTGVYCSVLLRPAGVPFAALGSLTVVAGLAVLEVANRLGVDAVLKWPNDVLAGPDHAKCAGILCEALSSDEAGVVVGIGINVLPLPERVAPGPGGLAATSLAEQQATSVDRTDVAAILLDAFAERERRWRAAGADLAEAGLLDGYRRACATLGQEVKVVGPDGATTNGKAVDVDSGGQLVLESGEQRRTVFAGDVVHLRW
ncbi:biotin--[acetyl-CoA-carboxylase] ligase [Amycolatopsis suaedae]|uniref:biotin--[biotin carboxyl-carrier protein] ligase n=1 Tax=Amycolatopsis suaedae TaxID=2510978 RepID=A0A4Q7J8N8_9PSEU|nr:biotin--[acetyl-CoA-carboxylase] ligase [Amycolatopsis suaedae]RZQ62743.1 biotin--[acetyl-CoA-carboxylase] ligase [Amycolatopsis suaedae]